MAAAPVAVPPADQPVQQPESAPRLQLQEGHIQSCTGYLKRRTKILKRWKKGWISIEPGKFLQKLQACMLRKREKRAKFVWG